MYEYEKRRGSATSRRVKPPLPLPPACAIMRESRGQVWRREKEESSGEWWAAGRGLAFKGGGRHRRTLMVGVEGRASPCAEAAWPSGSVRRLGNPRRNEDDDLTRRVVIKKADRRLHSLTGGAGTSGLGCRVLLPAPHLCHLRRGSGSDIYFNVSYLVTLPGTPHDDKA
jgi:hypothetical protein